MNFLGTNSFPRISLIQSFAAEDYLVLQETVDNIWSPFDFHDWEDVLVLVPSSILSNILHCMELPSTMNNYPQCQGKNPVLNCLSQVEPRNNCPRAPEKKRNLLASLQSMPVPFSSQKCF